MSNKAYLTEKGSKALAVAKENETKQLKNGYSWHKVKDKFNTIVLTKNSSKSEVIKSLKLT